MADTTHQISCGYCGRAIRIMIFRGTGYCSDNCRKALAAKAKKA